MLIKGNIIQILPQYQDPGDDSFIWVVVGDEEKGRVDISPLSILIKIKPVYTIEVNQVVLVQ